MTFEFSPVVATLVTGRLFASVVVVLSASLLRWAIIALVRRSSPVLSERQRWWINATKNTTVLLSLIGLVYIWRFEIGEAALSIAAVAVALVIATKELLLCLTGALWRGAAQPFAFGDWVEIGPHSGEVVEETFFATVLQEIDPEDLTHTGRMIAVPNSMLLTQAVVNHSFRKRFIFLTFEMYAEPTADPNELRKAALTALTAAAEEYAEVARRYAARIERTTGVQLPDPTPRVALRTTDMAKIAVRATVFCPREQAADVRDRAVTAFLAVASRSPALSPHPSA